MNLFSTKFSVLSKYTNATEEMSHYNPIQTIVRPFCLKYSEYHYGSKQTMNIHYKVNWADLVLNFKYCPKLTIANPNELLKSITNMTDPIWSKIFSNTQNQPLWVRVNHYNRLHI